VPTIQGEGPVDLSGLTRDGMKISVISKPRHIGSFHYSASPPDEDRAAANGFGRRPQTATDGHLHVPATMTTEERQ
jgi:hypothetical protein